MEYAEHGDLAAWLGNRGPQPERFVRHEIAAILGTLDVLHRGQAMHRDLTPFNVFVCENETLKLGDFGIATHQASRRGVTADAFNPLQAPTEIAWGKVRKWQQRDDVYQVGQLIAMLLRGDVQSPMRSKDVRTLPCSDHLKEVIHRCLGARAKRYQAADELIAALRHRPKEMKTGRIAESQGSERLLHRIPPPPAQGSHRGSPESGRALPGQPRSHHRRAGARSPQRAAGRRQGRRAQADGDPAARRQGAPRDDHRRGAVLEAGKVLTTSPIAGTSPSPWRCRNSSASQCCSP